MRNKNIRKNRSLARVFFTVLLSMLSIFAAFVVSGLAYLYYAQGVHPADSGANFLSNMLPSIPVRTNFVILGVDDDENPRTDLIIAGCFNSETNKVDLISIPRDTYVEVPKERRDILKNTGISMPQFTKINGIHSLAGKQYGVSFVVRQVEDLFGISVDYYVKVDLDAFRYMVDSIGGITVYVPQDMYYNDPFQDLYINLKEGEQTLTGEQAEGLVRFRKDPTGKTRSYPNADLERIQVQQMFIKEFVRAVTKTENIAGNPTAYMNALFTYIDTNLSMVDALKYLKYINDFSADNISGHTLPGNPKYMDGVSYFIYDEDETGQLAYDIFFKDNNAEPETSIGKEIVILNGGYADGMAANKRDLMEAEGFNVVGIGDSKEERTTYTRIFVRDDGAGYDLQKFFDEESKIIVDREATDEYEIIVIIGTEE